MFSPGNWPNRLRVSSASKCSTAAPSTGPHSVPMPPTIAATSASTELTGPKAMPGSMYWNTCT